MPVTIGGSGPITGVTSINTTVSDTELGYLDGLTEPLTTSLAAKLTTPGAWTSYTPILTATTNPTLGTGSTASGSWVRVGRIIFYRYNFIFGTSGVAAGSGQYFVSLPTNGTNGAAMPGSMTLLYDSSTGNAYTAAFPESNMGADKIGIAYGTGTTYTRVGATAPWTWAASDQIWGGIIYEAAS